MKNYSLIAILVLAICLNACDRPSTVSESTNRTSNLELPRIEVVPLEDSGTGRQYELFIKLPEGYSDSDSMAYPVVYYTDAMWHVEILSGSAEFIVEEAILVGISWQKDNEPELMEEVGAHVSRYRDYSISQSDNAEHQAKYHFGEAGTHLDFIRQDVIPYVEGKYSTDAEQRTYFGYSLGGLFGAYILLAGPDTFKNYILGSPSLWGDNPYLAELASGVKEINANVFLSNGTEEDDLVPLINEFVTLLKDLNDERLSLEHFTIAGSHQTAFPMTAVRSMHWLSGILPGQASVPEPE